jgi:hypothetical protein
LRGWDEAVQQRQQRAALARERRERRRAADVRQQGLIAAWLRELAKHGNERLSRPV